MCEYVQNILYELFKELGPFNIFFDISDSQINKSTFIRKRREYAK